MIVKAINKTIQEMCAEVEATSKPHTDWQSLSEEQLMYEAAVCMFSSQMIFEVAAAAAGRIGEHGLFNWSIISNETSDYEANLVAILCEPLSVEIDGKTRKMMPRFKNRWASLLSSTVEEIYVCGTSLYEILLSSRSSRDAREILVERVWGFGPKQASLFLRRIGYCSELAVLDTHVLDYLQLVSGITQKPGALSRLPAYERVEDEFRQVANGFGYPVGCVDLATWVTMRVAKREAWL